MADETQPVIVNPASRPTDDSKLTVSLPLPSAPVVEEVEPVAIDATEAEKQADKEISDLEERTRIQKEIEEKKKLVAETRVKLEEQKKKEAAEAVPEEVLEEEETIETEDEKDAKLLEEEVNANCSNRSFSS